MTPGRRRGETGSGKTTQLPKICLELGRGVTGQIGHTQPRRIAAPTVSALTEELGTKLAPTVGYQVRFNDNSSDETLVKLDPARRHPADRDAARPAAAPFTTR